MVFRPVAGELFCTRSHPIHDAATSQWSPEVRRSSTCTIDRLCDSETSSLGDVKSVCQKAHVTISEIPASIVQR